MRLLARLEDGHAQVRPLPAGEGVTWPEEPERAGPGMFWCRVGKKVYVKNAWSSAADLGIRPGWEVKKVDGTKVLDWLEERVEELSDVYSFSTDQQALLLRLPLGPGAARRHAARPRGQDGRGQDEAAHRGVRPRQLRPERSRFPPAA